MRSTLAGFILLLHPGRCPCSELGLRGLLVRCNALPAVMTLLLPQPGSTVRLQLWVQTLRVGTKNRVWKRLAHDHWHCPREAVAAAERHCAAWHWSLGKPLLLLSLRGVGSRRQASSTIVCACLQAGMRHSPFSKRLPPDLLEHALSLCFTQEGDNFSHAGSYAYCPCRRCWRSPLPTEATHLSPAE